jgi:hypothetical protein
MQIILNRLHQRPLNPSKSSHWGKTKNLHSRRCCLKNSLKPYSVKVKSLTSIPGTFAPPNDRAS